MAIYLAICDDNIAQRKQTERLLGREKDSRLKDRNEVLYIESFGSSDALLRTPVKYDMFFIDLTNESQNGMDIANILRQKGIIAPIVLCSSTINYKAMSCKLSEIYHLDMPVNQNTISSMIDKAVEWSKSKPALIEIRGSEITHYVGCHDIIKAHSVNERLVTVQLVDGSIIESTDSIINFYNDVNIYSHFIFTGKSIINANHVDSVAAAGFKMNDGEIVKCNILYKRKALMRFENHLKSNNSL